MQVINFSKSGMLICDNSSVNRYHLGSLINEIFLTVPPDQGSTETNNTHRVLPFISKGKIVRIFHKQYSSTSYYGIAFQQEAPGLSKKIDQVVNDFENIIRAGRFPA